MNPSDFTTISFPGLGIEINPVRGFDIFGLNIQL